MRRIDETGFGDIKIIQDTDAFCYGIDAVLLADFAAGSNMDAFIGDTAGSVKILDLGTGNGIIPLILCHKIQDVYVTGVEIQEKQAKIAEENAAANGLDNRIKIVCSDINDISSQILGSFDMITCNPPYFRRGAGMTSGNTAKMTARHETTADIEDFLFKACEMLKYGGQAAFVYRPGRLTELLNGGVKAGLFPAQLQMIQPFPDKNANIVLVRFIKGKKAELEVLPAISVRDNNGMYTENIDVIYERKK